MHRNGQQILVSRTFQFIYFYSENNMGVKTNNRRSQNSLSDYLAQKNSKLKSEEDQNFT